MWLKVAVSLRVAFIERAHFIMCHKELSVTGQASAHCVWLFVKGND